MCFNGQTPDPAKRIFLAVLASWAKRPVGLGSGERKTPHLDVLSKKIIAYPVPVCYNPGMKTRANVHIRPYQDRDRKAIVDLWEACGLVVPHNDPLRDIQRKSRVNPEWFLVGIRGGILVASCMVGYEGHRGWINYLAVSPAHRRLGIASMLMRRAEAVLSKAGCPKINLQVRETNQGGIAFYEQMGYLNDHVVSFGKRLKEGEQHADRNKRDQDSLRTER